MEEKDNLDIDEEMTKSLQRLVEEETNVAKASIGNDVEENNTQYNELGNTRNIDINLGATRFVDTDLINAKVASTAIHHDINNDASHNLADNGNIVGKDAVNRDNITGNSNIENGNKITGNNSIENGNKIAGNSSIENGNKIAGNSSIENGNKIVGNSSIENSNKIVGNSSIENGNKVVSNNSAAKHNIVDNHQTTGLSKRNKIVIASIVGVAVVAIVIGIIISVVVQNNKKSSYHYNYEMGMTFYKENNYVDAIKHLEIAFDSTEGKKNLDMMYVLSESYKKTGDTDKAIDVLETALTYNKFDEKSLSELLQLCYDNKNGEKINELIEKYKDSKIKNVLDGYLVAIPTTSETPGNFEYAVELNLLAQDDCTIYYTVDGSTPTKDSIRFTNPIKIEKDTVTVKTIAVNDIGVKSEVGEFKFTIDLKAPEAPILDIEDSKVKIGTKIRIKNLAEGDKAYYTVDGTTPSTSSSPYNDGIELKEGSYVLSVIVINKYNLSSTVTRKNITVKDETQYTYNQALSFLKKRMQELNIIEHNEKFSVGGETADFVYQTKQEISGILMYYIRLDRKSAVGSKVEGYYGVGVSDGQCYKVTDSDGLLSAVVY